MKPIRVLVLFILYLSLFIGGEAAASAAILESAKRNSNMGEGMRQKFDISDLKSDLVYKKIGDLEFTLDLMLPLKRTDDQKRPLYPDGTPIVFYFHGGWCHVGTPVVKYFSDNGLALVSPYYWLKSNSPLILLIHGFRGKRSPIPDYDRMWTITALNLGAMA